MLKVILRVALILLAAGIISGGLYLWVNQSGTSLEAGRPGGEEGGFRPELQAGETPPDREMGHREGGEGRWGDFGNGGVQHGLFDMTAKLGIILAITAVVVIIQKGVGWITHRRRLVRG